MKSPNLSRLTTAAVVCFGIVLAGYLPTPLHGAKITTPPPTGQSTQRSSVAQQRRLLEEKMQQQAADAAKSKGKIGGKVAPAKLTPTSQQKPKAVTAAKPVPGTTPPAATGPEPMTRNLIMIFDDGNDSGPLITELTTAIIQKCAFILITPALWQLLRSTSILDSAKGIQTDDALKKSIETQTNLSYAQIFFNPSEWETYQIDVVKNDVYFYLLIPNVYKTQILGAGEQTTLLHNQKLGFNLNTLKKVDLTQAPTSAKYSDNYSLDGNVAKALGMALVPSKTNRLVSYQWNVYCSGHGGQSPNKETIANYEYNLKKVDEWEKTNTKEAREKLARLPKQFGGLSIEELKKIWKQRREQGGVIASIAIPSFKAITDFFNDNVYTNLFFYSTCFAGGQHLLSPFTNRFGSPTALNYLLIAGAMMYTTSIGWKRTLSTTKPTDKQFTYPLQRINSTLPDGWFGTNGDFVNFFADLEAYAQGKKNYATAQPAKQQSGRIQPMVSPLIQTCNYIGNFLNPDGSVQLLENIPQIRFPGTQWFQLTKLGKDIDVTQITRMMVLQKNIQLNLTGAGKVPGFDLTSSDPKQDKKIVLLRTNFINIPTMVDRKTFLIPLINTLTFLEQDKKTNEQTIAQEQLKEFFNTPDIPSPFYFNLVISPVGFYDLLNTIWIRPELTAKKLNNFIYCIDTLVCYNDLTEEQFNTLKPTKEQLAAFNKGEHFLELRNVVIFVRLTATAQQKVGDRLVQFEYNNQRALISVAEPTKITCVEIKQKPEVLYPKLYAYCKEPTTAYYEFDEKNKKLYYQFNTLKEKAFYQQAAKDILSRDGKKRGLAIKSFQELWKSGKGIDEALTIAANNIYTEDPDASNGANILFNLLAYYERYCFIYNKVDGHDGKKAALALFKKLFAHAQGFTFAQAAIDDCEQKTEPAVKALIQELQATLNEAITVFYAQAAKDILSRDVKKRGLAIKSFTQLWESGKGIDEAFTVAANNIHATDPKVLQGAKSLFSWLSNHAGDCFKNNEVDGPTGKKAALALFKKLFAHAQGFEDAQEAINDCEQKTEPAVKALIQELQDALNKAQAKAAPLTTAPKQ